MTPFRIASLVTVAVVFIILSSGLQSYNTLKDKASKQQESVTRLQRWKAAYQALLPVSERWENTYMDSNKVHDMLSMYKSLDLASSGLDTDPEKLQIVDIQPAGGDAAGLGLTLATLASGGRGEIMTLYSRSFESLIRGLQLLSQRKDISMGAVTLTTEQEVPTAYIEKFAVYLRTASQEG